MTARERIAVAAMVAWVVIGGAWAWWPAIGCDGDVVRGAFRMTCIEDKP